MFGTTDYSSFSSKFTKCFLTTFGEAHGEPDWRISPAGN